MIKKIIWNLRGGYIPGEFWEKWSKTFMDDPWQRRILPQHWWILEIIKKEKPESILEVGCGFGRNISFLIQKGINPKVITGFDISSNMIELAGKKVKNKDVKLFTSDLTDFKVKKKYDLVFTHGVLMHIKKNNINDAIEMIISLSKKNIILIEQNYEADNNYTFVHDYRVLLSSGKVNIIEHKKNKKLGLDLIYAKVQTKK